MFKSPYPFFFSSQKIGITNYPIGVGINAAGEVIIADNHNNFNLSVFSQDGQLLAALESKVKHAQCFDVSLMDDGSVVLASKDYRLYIYRYVQVPPIGMWRKLWRYRAWQACQRIKPRPLFWKLLAPAIETSLKQPKSASKQITNKHTHKHIDNIESLWPAYNHPHPALKPLLHIITVHLFVSLTLTLAILFFNWFDHYYYILNLYPWTENKLRVDCLRSSPQALICFFPYYLLYICFYQMRPVNTVLYTVY